MAATLASVALHAGLAWALAETTFGSGSQVPRSQADTALVIPLALTPPPVPPLPRPEPTPPPEPKPVEPPPELVPEQRPPEASPGIDNSTAKTDAWVGFAEATENRGRKSETDQSALAPAPGLPVEVAAQAPPPQAPQDAGPPAPAEPEVKDPDPAEQRAAASGAPRAAASSPQEQEGTPGAQATEATLATQPEGPSGEADPTGGQVTGADKPATQAPGAPDRTLEGESQAKEALAKQVSPSARPEAKDEEGQRPTSVEDVGEVAEQPQAEVVGERARDEDGVMPEAKPAQRLAQAAEGARPEQRGVEAGEVGPPVPGWLRELGDLQKAATAKELEATQKSPAGAPRKSPASETAAPRPLPAAGTPAAGDAPGEKSDSEATATSTFEVSTLQFGKVLARQGLKIRTARPRFSSTTLLTAAPRDATMEIVFGRDGSVIRARFPAGQTTGIAEVDSVLLRSAYRWEASGRELERIPAGKPDAGVTVKIKFLLR